MEEHQYIGLQLHQPINAVVFIVIILSCLFVGAIFKTTHWDRYFPASAASIVVGFGAGLIFNVVSDQGAAFVFSSEILFFLLLPPIVTEAGYTLKRKQFFKNFGTILNYAFMGTFISCLAFAGILYLFATYGLIPLNADNPLECLIFGALISATDPVATLAMLNSPEVNVPPTLYALVFGESILNDAISIVLFNSFKGLIELDENNRPVSAAAEDFQLGWAKFLTAVGNFLYVSLGSIVVGCVIALICSFLTRKINFRQYAAYEVTLIVLFAWLSYFVNEALELSGIMGIFFASIVLAHYAYYNVSPQAQVATHEAFKSIAQIAETFVFAYIGIAVGMSVSARPLKWHVGMMFLSIFACFISRAVNVFPLSALSNVWRKDKIPVAMQIPIWWAGLRGAVAVALSFSFPLGYSDDGNMPYVVTSTLGIVLTTTILQGGSTVQVLDACEMNGGQDAVEANDGHSHAEDHDTELAHEESAAAQQENYNRYVVRFRRFDRTFMRKWFGGNIKSSLLVEDQYGNEEEAGGEEDYYGKTIPDSHSTTELAMSSSSPAILRKAASGYLDPASGMWAPHSRADTNTFY